MTNIFKPIEVSVEGCNFKPEDRCDEAIEIKISAHADTEVFPGAAVLVSKSFYKKALAAMKLNQRSKDV